MNDSREPQLPQTPASEDLAPRLCVACDYDLRGSDAAICPECGFEQSESGTAPGAPVARRLDENPAAGIAATLWLLRWPSRAIGASANLAFPMARVAWRLLPVMAFAFFLSDVAYTAILIEIDRTWFPGEPLRELALVVLTSPTAIALNILGSFILALTMLAFWRVQPDVRRPWELTALLFGGVLVGSLFARAATLQSLLIENMVGPGSFGPLATRLFEWVILVAAYVIGARWSYLLLRPVTPAADRSALAFLVGVIHAAQWSYEEPVGAIVRNFSYEMVRRL